MAGLPMEAILGDRACRRHRACPAPCVQCAGLALSHRDVAKGGFKGSVPRFEAPIDSSDDEVSLMVEAEVSVTVSGWGRQKQLHAVGISVSL